MCGNLLYSNRKLLHPLTGYVSVHSLTHNLLVHISEDVFVEETSTLRTNVGAGDSVSLVVSLKLKRVALPLTCPMRSTPVSWTRCFASPPLFAPSGKPGQDGGYDFIPGLPDHRSRFGLSLFFLAKAKLTFLLQKLLQENQEMEGERFFEIKKKKNRHIYLGPISCSMLTKG